MKPYLTLLLIVLSLCATASFAEPIAPATPVLQHNAISNSVKQGEVAWLDAGGTKFLAIYNPAKAKARGAVIILPAQNGNPNWAEVIGPLRRQLPNFNWATLAIALPTEPHKAAQLRIKAALDFLQAKKIKTIFLLGYGSGGDVGLDALASNTKALKGLILLSAYTPSPEAKKAKALNENKNFPILDIIAANDFARVKRQALLRSKAFAEDNNYQFIEIKGADHYYSHLTARLIKRLRGWLQKNATS